MSSSKIRLGILGGGGNSLIGVLHRIASSMFDRYQIVGGVFNPNWDENIEFATKIGLPTDRVYIDFETLVAQELQLPKEQRMQVVSILTKKHKSFIQFFKKRKRYLQSPILIQDILWFAKCAK